MINHPEQNTIGQESKKKVKFRQIPNTWIPVEDYRPHPKHHLLFDNGEDFFNYKLASITNDFVGWEGIPIKVYCKNHKVKRVMILSRK
jgi:hypothetical protein